jgi:hypothetical protein
LSANEASLAAHKGYHILKGLAVAGHGIAQEGADLGNGGRRAVGQDGLYTSGEGSIRFEGYVANAQDAGEGVADALACRAEDGREGVGGDDIDALAHAAEADKGAAGIQLVVEVGKAEAVDAGGAGKVAGGGGAVDTGGSGYGVEDGG